MSEKETTKQIKELTGIAVKRSGDKTVAVEVKRVQVHPLYQKRRSARKIYLAHDEENAVEIGSTVTIRQTRPLSARKRWRVVMPKK